MNLVKDNIYIYARVLFLLIIVYSNIFIADVDLIENNNENIEQNPWKEIMAKYDVSKVNNEKPVKGAKFGKWKGNKCKALHNEDLSNVLYGLEYCTGQMHNGTWRFYSINTFCVFSNEKPDCLIYDRTAYSFFPFSTSKIENYVLPSCIDASKDWIINAKCGTTIKQNYTCDGKDWVGTNNSKISNCESSDTWQSIEEEDDSYEEDEDKIPDEKHEYEIHEKEDDNKDIQQNQPKEVSEETDENTIKPPQTTKQNPTEKSLVINGEQQTGEKSENEEDGLSDSALRGGGKKKNSEPEKSKKVEKKDIAKNESDETQIIVHNKETDGEHIIKKDDNKNNTQEIIDTSVLSSCDQIGISFGMLIAVVTVFLWIFCI